jgi:hypothetical protein
VHDVTVGGPVRAGAGRQAARVGADQARAVPGRDLGQPRVGAAPGVVQQVRTRLGDHLGDLRAPGVDADHHVRVALAHRRDQASHPVDLGRGGDLVAGSRLDPADVDDLGPVGHRPAGRVEGGAELDGGPAVEERVWRPVDHGHDPERAGWPRPRAEPERPRAPVCHRSRL